MSLGIDPVAALGERFSAAIRAAFPELGSAAAQASSASAQPGSASALAGQASIDPQVRASANPKFGDFQCNAAMGLGKQLGLNPRQVAERIVKHLDLGELAEPVTAASIAGPGFINVTLRPSALGELLAALDTPGLAVELPQAERETVVVDLCGVNLAKQMHVGHLRSTVIGDALARILARLGHTVKRQNHLGDWGLPIAMVTARVMAERDAGWLDLAKLTLDDLDKAYRAAQRECDADERGLKTATAWGSGPKIIAELDAQVAGAREAEARAKQVLLRLQAHDAEVYAVWQRLAEVTMDACLAICKRLNADVRPEHTAGESSYSEQLAGLVDDLLRRGVAKESDGALVVPLEDEQIDEPCLIRKRDGGFLYATTDLAAIRHRVQKLGASRVVYCVDARQSLHFKQVFAAATKAGYATPLPEGGAGGGLRAGPARLEHAAFGTILGEDGRPFKTRSGENVKLSDLLDEAQQRAAKTVSEKNPDLPAAERDAIAWAVSIAAIRYADLSTERIKDYVFAFDRMLAFEGNTGPYLLYALVRIKSIFRKAAERGVNLSGPPAALVIREPAEKTLALTLLRYPGAVRGSAEALMPSRLCAYLYELAGAFSSFFDQCPVLAADDDQQRAARLRLCGLVERVLSDGLGTLGLPTVERM
jgi:arginyl-tRNA synthetase